MNIYSPQITFSNNQIRTGKNYCKNASALTFTGTKTFCSDWQKFTLEIPDNLEPAFDTLQNRLKKYEYKFGKSGIANILTFAHSQDHINIINNKLKKLEQGCIVLVSDIANCFKDEFVKRGYTSKFAKTTPLKSE